MIRMANCPARINPPSAVARRATGRPFAAGTRESSAGISPALTGSAVIRIVEWGFVCEDGSREKFGTLLKVQAPQGSVEREITDMRPADIVKTAVSALGLEEAVEVVSEFEPIEPDC